MIWRPHDFGAGGAEQIIILLKGQLNCIIRVIKMSLVLNIFLPLLLWIIFKIQLIITTKLQKIATNLLTKKLKMPA
jgi:hypothetical protein